MAFQADGWQLKGAVPLGWKTGQMMRIRVIGYMAIAALAVALAGPALAQSDDAAGRCAAIAGPPDAGAPVSREAVTEYFNRLDEARAACEAAATGTEPDPLALFHLGVLAQRDGDHDMAAARFRVAADGGLAAALTKLGDYHNFGVGPMVEDHARAVEAYRSAAEAGDLPAKATLGIMYLLGRGVPQDAGRMVELLTEAADGGYHFAQFRLAQVLLDPASVPEGLAAELDLPDPVRAAGLLEQAAAQGNANAGPLLAELYADETLFDDPVRQAEWTRRAAEAGYPQAINALGFLYERGKGVDYDPARAAALYVQAIESGDVDVNAIRGKVDGRVPRWDRDTALAFQTILKERGLYRGALDALVGTGTLNAARKLVQE